MDRFLKFSDFTTKKKYCQLQERFCLNDERGSYEKILEPFDNRTITILKIDFEGTEDYKSIRFIEDYLMEYIPKMSQNYFRRFINTINSKALILKEQRSELANIYINNSSKTLKTLCEIDFIKDNIILLLIDQLELLEVDLNDYLKDPYPEIQTKIKFNWSRVEIIYFFHLLRENNYIEDIRDAHLGRIIDRVVEYYKGEEYLPINNSRKHLNDFKLTSGRSESKANENLKEYFSEDFFNI